MSNDRSKLVYSTDHPTPGREKMERRPVDPALGRTAGRLSVRLERKGRAGKSVTVIEGLRLDEKAKERLLKQLKACLGTGGTLKDGVIEIQGDHRAAIIDLLEERGIGPGGARR